ncbi:MAG: molybdopterin molybdotransferase MoeA [Phycisphaerales bacterium]|nr:molybdopterin molybdotransferase MoeA [Phycisphaerales bacterium]
MSCCNGTTTGFAFDSPTMAIDALCAEITTIDSESIPWNQAMGRVMASDAHSDRPSPSCDASAMDGYALRIEDCKPGTIEIASEIHIGQKPQPMPSGKTLQIVTGAPVPDGVHVIIKREDVTELTGCIELSDQLIQSLKPGMNIRRIGENMPAGTRIPCAGRIITAPIMGMLTGFGIANPTVHKQVKLGIITTGNEVVAPHETPSKWQLRDSNASSIIALCNQHRWIKIESHNHAGDTFNDIKTTAQKLLETCDALVFTGGVSMGDHDHVPAIIESIGAQTIFHKLPQRPGKPALGAAINGKPILGLPGNPVSVMTTAHRLLIPSLAIRAGIQGQTSTPRMMRIINSDDKSLRLYWNRLAKIVSHDTIELVSSKGSGDVPSSAMSDGFVELTPGQSGPGPWPFWSWLG